MKNIHVEKVQSRTEVNDFINLPKRIYADNKCYVPDLDLDVRDNLKNVQAFIAYDNTGNAVGRVAAFINLQANEKWGQTAVRFSEIDFINDFDVAKALMDAVEEWGLNLGMNTVMGPMGLYDYDKEGMLIEGFDQLSSMIEIYNESYYPAFMEKLGYTKAADWIQTRMKIPKEVPKMYARVAKYAREELGLKVRKITNEDIFKGGYGKKIFDLLNEAYAPLFGFTEIPSQQVEQYINQYFRLVDKRLISVIENEKGEIVGTCVTMGSLSHALQKSDGRLFPIGWCHLIRSLKWKHEDTVQLLLIAVKPDYQGYGVSSLMFEDLISIYNDLGFKWAETGPQLENNHKELSQWKPLNPEIIKRRRCYTKILNK